jgi:hypothetical protein
LVREQIEKLLQWSKASSVHPLVKSCVFHYEFEFIHPFTDGNGKIGRIWQTLILYIWKKIFSWLPVESLIKERQVNMKSKYSEIVKHIPNLEDHGHLYMYYGFPYSEECYVYGDDVEGNNLIVSYECDDLCITIADEFQYDYEWLEILDNNQIELESIFDFNIETMGFEVIVALLLYLVESITFEDKFIDALNNRYLIRLIKRLEYLG